MTTETGTLEGEPTKRELTFGEKAVGMSFNPGGSDQVNAIKHFSANLIDILDLYRRECNNGEQAAQLTLAIRKIQEGQMWGVKAVTWQY